MTKHARYMSRPGSKVVERFLFDSFKEAHRFECNKLYNGWTCYFGFDYPQIIDVPGYEQLRLF